MIDHIQGEGSFSDALSHNQYLNPYLILRPPKNQQVLRPWLPVDSFIFLSGRVTIQLQIQGDHYA